MIETILFVEPSARSRFLAAPCLKEREQYLYHLMRQGYGPSSLRVTSGLMLRVVQILGLTKLRTVELEEIERGAACPVIEAEGREVPPPMSIQVSQPNAGHLARDQLHNFTFQLSRSDSFYCAEPCLQSSNVNLRDSNSDPV